MREREKKNYEIVHAFGKVLPKSFVNYPHKLQISFLQQTKGDIRFKKKIQTEICCHWPVGLFYLDSLKNMGQPRKRQFIFTIKVGAKIHLPKEEKCLNLLQKCFIY